MVVELEVSAGGMYGWVKEGVLEIPSLFVDMESVRQLGSPLLWVREGQNIKIEFLPCSSVDRVCHEGKGADWFFMYTCVLAEIGIQFSFTKFECAVLRQLNCAPSQIHPNSWGFIRAFEVLMEYLQEEPSLGLFFFLFQVKGVDRGVWATLSSHQGRTVFSLFKANYRDFKKFYVKVRSPEDAIPFFLDKNLSEKFLCIGKGIRFKTKVPDCSMVGLKSFFKQRVEREVSTSHVVKVEHGSEVNKPAEKRKPVSLKRMRTEEVSRKRAIDLMESRCCVRDVALEKVVEFIADEHFQSKADVDMLKRTGKVAAARYVQVQAARLMCISRGLELQALEEESSQKSKKANVLELEKKLRFATEQVGLKEKENGLLKEENDELRVTIAKLNKDKKDLESRVVEVCRERKEAEVSKWAHGFEMFAAAWDRAKAQIELLVPGADLENMDPVKVAYKGELVDDDQVPAEGSDDHNPAK
ncbi:hypothetical protein PIB30_080230 [Stylosanthes scabra]|uniref:Transposase (putative) gypsy type domain-containing protein n=1 Tax=Stylosanthes scabra TaxID=79078 RepID=A0ABU6UV35_9FABA|nr:hypothetical protein [Stylosanthes scabra]